MARTFNGSTQYIEVDSALLSSTPFSVSLWYNTAEATAGCLFWLGDKDVSNSYYTLDIDSSTLGAGQRDSGSAEYAIATTNITTNAWENAIGVFASDSSRSVYLNGANSATNSVAQTAISEDRTSIGRLGDSTPAGFFNGSIAEVGVWNRVLTADEISALSKGASPLYFPNGLVMYKPMIRGSADVAKAFSMTEVNTPGQATSHPRIFYPFRSQIQHHIAAGGATDVTALPTVLSATFSLQAPTVSTVRNVTVSPTVLSATFSLLDPTVVVGGDVTVLPSVLTLTMNLQAPTVVIPSERFVPKTFVYKVYTSAGSYVTNWSDDVISVPNFTTAINAGPGEMTVRLARPFESFGEEEDVIFGNRVDCYVYDSDEPDGLLLYRGFISAYAPILEAGREFVRITLLPYISIASRIMLREASGATQVPFLSKDPSDVMRGVLTRGILDGLDVETSPSSIDDTSTVVSYTFNTNTVKEGLEKALELAPDGWYWRVDPDGTFHFHEKPDDVTHDLLIGKHIKTMQPEKRIENIINRVYFTGGGDPPLYTVYSRESSISTYGLRAVKVVDQRVTLSATAQIISQRILNESEAPEVRTRLVIVDNNGLPVRGGYDIESIKVGDTIRIKNLQYGQKSETLWDVGVWDVDVWDQTLSSIAGSALLVVKTSYQGGNTIEVETSSRFPVVSKRIEDINRNLTDSQTVNNPSSPS